MAVTMNLFLSLLACPRWRPGCRCRTGVVRPSDWSAARRRCACHQMTLNPGRRCPCPASPRLWLARGRRHTHHPESCRRTWTPGHPVHSQVGPAQSSVGGDARLALGWVRARLRHHPPSPPRSMRQPVPGWSRRVTTPGMRAGLGLGPRPMNWPGFRIMTCRTARRWCRGSVRRPYRSRCGGCRPCCCSAGGHS